MAGVQSTGAGKKARSGGSMEKGNEDRILDDFKVTILNESQNGAALIKMHKQ